MEWHQMETESVIEELRTPVQGLSSAEACARLVIYGANELTDTRRIHPIIMLFAQFKNFMIMILIAAAIVSGLVGEFSDTIVLWL